MRKQSTVAVASCIAVLGLVGGLMALPILALAVGGTDSGPTCSAPVEVDVAEDGTPSILGPSTLTVADVRTWWTSTGHGQPPRLRTGIDDLIAMYLNEGEAEGVRGDLAFAQAVGETGHFTNSDTSINNYAGIAHYDGTASGAGFSRPLLGVRAQIQLLKKYAAGNDVALAHHDVSPNAGAHATTWGGLAGTWASADTYWQLLDRIYTSMLESGGGKQPHLGTVPGGVATACSPDEPAMVGEYALPVDRRWYDEHPDWFRGPHHDYPAIDIPVPTGTPLFAVTNGVVVSTPTSGKCGIGVILNGDDGAQYTYCHGDPGTQAVTTGDRVDTGQHLMDSASTGNSTGPHLHFGVKVGATRRCPQGLLTQIADGTAPASATLPDAGCIS